MAAWARGVMAAHGSHVAGAVHEFCRIRHPTIARSAAVDRLEAAARAGRADLVRIWSEDLAAVDADWAAAAAEHGRALISAGDDAGQHFEHALRLHVRSGRPVSLARTQLVYGEFLRRNRRRVDARAQLTPALQVFTDLPAGPWAERARRELRASGSTARTRGAVAAGALTPRERQAALLVGEGLANRDIAARLFLGPRTVEYHLSNVYAKLGVRSRGELASSSSAVAATGCEESGRGARSDVPVPRLLRRRDDVAQVPLGGGVPVLGTLRGSIGGSPGSLGSDRGSPALPRRVTAGRTPARRPSGPWRSTAWCCRCPTSGRRGRA
ncbi:regulatory protein, luxR family [Geodermatophilus amargosae]|uniref:Regulatory protein, luxR family n=1 Tax=Geodermatophilus amargosae TaxID=1296565 RepID=A0A1I7BJ88_9ACTN|nr:helix-turn-helix transcriptional regulator [Geodermatophilus amargosae]SFT87225.1 regulatory protein, luxR family [Geodermatophilus amargosae]